MKKRSILSLLLTAAMILSLTACGGSKQDAPANSSDSNADAPQETVTLSFAHDKVETHPVHQAALKFKEIVEEKTNGAVKIDIFPNQDLGSPTDVAEQVSIGTVDINVVSPGIMDK